jgi:WD40 repeat protein
MSTAPTESSWYFAQDRRKIGPVSWPRLREMAAAGQLAPTDMLLREGATRWQPASTVEGLFAASTEDSAGLPETVTYAGSGPLAPTATWWPSISPDEVPPPPNRPPRAPAIPGYQILSELGRGGMGVVYKAEQVALKRLVALKMILAGAHAGSQLLERFRLEAEAVARLQHPNIVQIYEIGEHEGLPFFSLEFCADGSLAARLDGTPLPAPEAARLVEALARAMQAAHEKGIVHRDLKPANVLLAVVGSQLSVVSQEREAASALTTDNWQLTTVPKITDFGLAKLAPTVDGEPGSGPTQSGAIMGTPSYMAPEQAAGKTREIGPAADLYALGAILYELLTGRPPFRGATVLDTLEQVRSAEPVAPSRLQPKLPRDLETICLKCLQKEPGKRYVSAVALADDLGRFLRGEPIQARPVGAVERAVKWTRRRPTVAALSAAVVLTVLVGLLLVSWKWREAVKARNDADARTADEALAREDAQHAQDRAEQEQKKAEIARGVADDRKQAAERSEGKAIAEKNRAEHQLLRADTARYALEIAQAQQELARHHADRAEEILSGCRWDLRRWEHRYLWTQCQARRRVIGDHTHLIEGLCFSPDGRHVATSSAGLVHVWDVDKDKKVFQLPGSSSQGNNLAYSPDGKLLAVVATDPTVKLYDAATGHDVRELKGLTGRVADVCFDGEGKRLAAAGQDQTIKVWDPATGKDLLSIPGTGFGGVQLAFSPDGKRLAAIRNLTVQVWDTGTGQEVLTLRGLAGFSSVCYSTDGKHLATGSAGGVVKLWDAATGMEVRELKSHNPMVTRLRYSPDGKRLAAGGTSWQVDVWNPTNGLELFSLPGYSSFDFSADGKRLAAGHFDSHTLRIWDAEGGREAVPLLTTSGLKRVRFSPDGRRLAVADFTEVKVWDLAAGRTVVTVKDTTGGVEDVAFSPDGRRLACALSNKKVRLWDATTGQDLLTIDVPMRFTKSMSYRPNGRHIAVAGDDPLVRVWDAATGKEVFSCAGHNNPVSCVRYSPDGKRLASTSWNLAEQTGLIKLWDADTGAALSVLKGHTHQPTALCFSPVGKYLVSAGTTAQGQRCELKVWDLASGQEVVTFAVPGLSIMELAFTPDGQRLVSAGQDKTVRFWDPSTGQEVLSFKTDPDIIASLSFSPDGRRLVLGSMGGTVQMWEALAEQEAFTLTGHASDASSVGFSPDGRWLASGSADRTVKVWDMLSGQEAFTLRGHAARISSVAFAPDGRRLASASLDQTVKVWDVLTGQVVYSCHADIGRDSNVCFSPDGRFLAAPGPDKTVILWDAETGREIRRLHGERFRVNSVCFSPDGKRLVAAGTELCAWDVRTGREIPFGQGILGTYTSVCYSRDGKYLAVSSNLWAQVFDAQTGRAVQVLGGPRGASIGGVCFTPDGRLLATAGPDRVVAVWDFATGKDVLDLKGHTLMVQAVSVRPDGKYLASAGMDGTVRVWDLRALLARTQGPPAAARWPAGRVVHRSCDLGLDLGVRTHNNWSVLLLKQSPTP